MKITRIFSGENYKGEPEYLKTQRKYNLSRTLLFFGISAALFIAGFIATKSKNNLLTVVAVLGCLPASKSLVETIMFYRYKGCDSSKVSEILKIVSDIPNAFDRVFTSYDENYVIYHLVVKNKNIVCYGKEGINENNLRDHLSTLLKAENYTDYTIKCFTDFAKYKNRLVALNEFNEDNPNDFRVLKTLLDISL